VTHSAEAQVEIARSPVEVWSCLTAGERLTAWFANSGDLSPGGAFQFDFGDGDQFTGRVTGWHPTHQLELEWRFMGLGPRFLIRFDLEPIAQGTRVRVRDTGSRTAADADSLREGWIDFIGRLQRHVETGENARYEWSQTIGTAVCAPGAPQQVLTDLRDPTWWSSGFPGLHVTSLPAPGANQLAFDFHAPQWGEHTTRAVVTVEPDAQGSYVGVSHVGWTELPLDIRIAERRRVAGLWREALARCNAADG
jgi:uncharacterized protein YndB with AHSA1/START domain